MHLGGVSQQCLPVVLCRKRHSPGSSTESWRSWAGEGRESWERRQVLECLEVADKMEIRSVFCAFVVSPFFLA